MPRQNFISRCSNRSNNNNNNNNIKYHEENDSNENDPITFFLIAEKKTYHGGGGIHGTVSFFIPQSAAGCDDFSGVHLLMEGKETVKMFIAESFKYERFNESIVKVDTEAISLPSLLIPGQYEYPFFFKLPESLPSSMHCSSSDDRCTCDIHYTLTAYMRRRSSGTTIAKSCSVVNCSQLIRIGPPPSNTPPVSLQFTAVSPSSDSSTNAENNDDIKLKACTVKSWLLRKGKIDLGVQMDRTVVSPNSSVNVTVAGRNRSSIAVNYLWVRWIETVNYGYTTRRILSQSKVKVDHLPSWRKQESGKQKNKQRWKENHEKGKKYSLWKKTHGHSDGQNHVPPIEKIQVQLQLKGGRNSYNGELVRIYHSLQVIAVTEGEHVTKPIKKVATEVQQLNETVPVMAKAQVVEQQLSPLHPVSDRQDNDNGSPSEEKIPQAAPILMDDLSIPFGVTAQKQYTNACHSSPSLCADSCSVLYPVVEAQIMEPYDSALLTQVKEEACF